MVRVLSLAAGALLAGGGARAAQLPLFEPGAGPRGPARLAVALAAEPPAAVPGRPLTLRFEMRPAPGIHVYAPGNPGYIPVSVMLTASPGVQVHAAVYPEGENYVFGELREVVKVYSRAFEVRQQIVVGRDAAKAALSTITIGGSVRYQACDDKVCFPPATVPVSITLPIARRASRAAGR
jgi:DsbC/DsbD-like thiol-disulfide interchange protein